MGRQVSGTLYRRGEVWWVKYVVNGARVRESLETGDKREARRRADAKVAPLRLKDEADRARALAHRAADLGAELAALDEARRDKLTVGEAWPAFVADKTRPQSGPHTLADYRRHWLRFQAWLAENEPGVTTLEGVTPQAAAAFMSWLESLGLGPNRYNKARQALSLVFRTLAPRCAGMADPFAAIQKRRLQPEGHRELTEAELRRVCEAADGELKVLLALGVYCGFRVADACGLLWSEVDSDRGVIVRLPSKTRGRTGRPVVVPVHTALGAVLLEWCPTPEMRTGHVLPGLAASYAADNGAKVAKLVRDHFARVGVDGVNTRQAQREREQAGATGRLRAPARVAFHSLRHSLVSQMARRGVPLSVVRELVGHSSEAVQKLYLHVDTDSVRRAVEVLPPVTVPALPEAAGDPAALRRELGKLARQADAAALRRAIGAIKGA